MEYDVATYFPCTEDVVNSLEAALPLALEKAVILPFPKGGNTRLTAYQRQIIEYYRLLAIATLISSYSYGIQIRENSIILTESLHE